MVDRALSIPVHLHLTEAWLSLQAPVLLALKESLPCGGRFPEAQVR